MARSLNAIYKNKELLCVRRFGFYSFRLFSNKVLRRLLPVFLLMLLVGSVLAAPTSVFARLLLLTQGAGYIVGLAALRLNPLPGGVSGKMLSFAMYFVVGNTGMFLGMIDFLRGRLPATWEPEKKG